MMNQKKIFGFRIKKLRKDMGWTQENLAERMDITPNYLSSIERGKENPTFDMLMNFSESFNVEMWELFDFGCTAKPEKIKKILSCFTNNLTENLVTGIQKTITDIMEQKQKETDK